MQKLAIISDIHGNAPNLEKAIGIIEKEKIDYIICTGDVQGIECWEMLDKLPIPVYAVLGNVDHDILGYEQLSHALKNTNLFSDLGEIELDKQKIIFGHYPDIVKKAIIDNPGRYTLALYGHTHRPWEENFNNTKLLNSGNVGNFRYPPTFAIVNLETLKAKLILLDEIQ